MKNCVRLAWGMLALALAACNPPSAPPLRIASSPWPGYEPIYLARDLGYLSTSKVNVFELPSSDITLEAFRNHSADLATLTLDETLDLLDGGVKLRVLLVMDESNGADAVMVRPEIKSLTELKGKRIVIENLPLGAYMLTRLLQTANLSRNDVTILPSAESRHPEMYRQNKADAFITFDPFKTQIASMGGHVLFDSSQIPHEIFDLLLVHEDVFQTRRAEVCEVAKQWFRSLTYLQQAPADAAARIRKRLNVTPTEYQAMMSGINAPDLAANLRLLGGENPAIVPPMERMKRIMLQDGQLKHDVDFAVTVVPNMESCLAP